MWLNNEKRECFIVNTVKSAIFVLSKEIHMKLLVTGASGFIGSFLVESGIERGYEVWAGMRSTSSRTFLPVEHVSFVELDLASPEKLASQLIAFKKEFGRWDYVIHAAGVTKCIDKKEFFRVNYEGTKNLVDALETLGMAPLKFIYLSSLSVFGPVREGLPYTPIMDSDVPCPDTEYGKSKLMAERYIMGHASFPYMILRPTGVYGPREKDYFKMALSIKKHVDFAVGYRPQVITFIYVKDLVKAVFLAMESNVENRCYFVSEPQGYGSRAFSDLIQREMGVKHVLHVKAPVWLLKVISLCAGLLSGFTGKPSTLNSDKYRIMKQRNWLCDTEPIEKELGFKAGYTLEKGTIETIKWYKKEQWL